MESSEGKLFLFAKWHNGSTLALTLEHRESAQGCWRPSSGPSPPNGIPSGCISTVSREAPMRDGGPSEARPMRDSGPSPPLRARRRTQRTHPQLGIDRAWRLTPARQRDSSAVATDSGASSCSSKASSLASHIVRERLEAGSWCHSRPKAAPPEYWKVDGPWRAGPRGTVHFAS